VLRNRLEEIQAQTDAEKEWWEKRRAVIQKDFMKELDDSEKTSAKSEEDAVLVESHTPSGTPAGTPSGSKKKKGKK